MSDELPPDPPEHVILSAMQWREEQKRRSSKAGPDPEQMKAQANGHAEPLPTVVAATRADKDVPGEFIDPASEIIPIRNVTLLGGDGGTGKSLLALQLALACTTAMTWIGLEVAQGPVVYFSAEDDLDELTRRMNRICRADGIELASSYELHLLPFAGEDAALVTENHKANSLITTKLLERLEATLESLTPLLLILDNLADVYCGNENNRSLAKAFIGKLRGLCLRYDCTVMILAHPSLTGRASGTGESGSTAWSNSVRSRLYLRRDKDGSGYEADKNARVLEIMKANYGPPREPFGLRWEDGRFVRRDMPKTFDNVSVADLEAVKEAFKAGNYRCDERASDWGGYVVAGIVDFDIGAKGCSKEQRSAEQERARQRVIRMLATWERNKQIGREERLDAQRKSKPFYTGA